MNSTRQTNRNIAEQTFAILNEGRYKNEHGSMIDLRPAAENAVNGTRLFDPNWKPDGAFNRFSNVDVSFSNETTIAAGHRLVVTERLQKVAALNFASAKNPGGGFLKGASAQEESLARSSALYMCLNQPRMSTYYSGNRKYRSCLYTDYVIYSPAVPFFRLDNGFLLGEPFNLDIVTSPAVNLTALRRNQPSAVLQAQPTMIQRGFQILSICASEGVSTLILGAWGCGVFGNSYEEVGRMWSHLLQDPRLHGAFSKVVFAVPGPKLLEVQIGFDAPDRTL